jgi:hypothetical protein
MEIVVQSHFIFLNARTSERCIFFSLSVCIRQMRLVGVIMQVL